MTFCKSRGISKETGMAQRKGRYKVDEGFYKPTLTHKVRQSQSIILSDTINRVAACARKNGTVHDLANIIRFILHPEGRSSN